MNEIIADLFVWTFVPILTFLAMWGFFKDLVKS